MLVSFWLCLLLLNQIPDMRFLNFLQNVASQTFKPLSANLTQWSNTAFADELFESV